MRIKFYWINIQKKHKHTETIHLSIWHINQQGKRLQLEWTAQHPKNRRVQVGASFRSSHHPHMQFIIMYIYLALTVLTSSMMTPPFSWNSMSLSVLLCERYSSLSVSTVLGWERISIRIPLCLPPNTELVKKVFKKSYSWKFCTIAGKVQAVSCIL